MPPHELATRAPEPDEQGQAVVIILEPLAANSPFRRFEIIRLPHAEAMALVRGRKAEFVLPESLVEPPRLVASAFVGSPINVAADAANRF